MVANGSFLKLVFSCPQVKCEEHVNALTPKLFDFFLANPFIGELRIVQYVAPLEWLTDMTVIAAAQTSLVNSEMIMLSNTGAGGNEMALSMEAVEALIEASPNLSVLGNLVRFFCLSMSICHVYGVAATRVKCFTFFVFQFFSSQLRSCFVPSAQWS